MCTAHHTCAARKSVMVFARILTGARRPDAGALCLLFVVKRRRSRSFLAPRRLASKIASEVVPPFVSESMVCGRGHSIAMQNEEHFQPLKYLGLNWFPQNT